MPEKEVIWTPRVIYCYDSDVALYTYGTGHPMKPFRSRLTHHLLLLTDVFSKVEIFVSTFYFILRV